MEKAEQKKNLAGECDKYRKNISQLRQRLAAAKNKAAKLQAREDLEYNKQQLKDEYASATQQMA